MEEISPLFSPEDWFGNPAVVLLSFFGGADAFRRTGRSSAAKHSKFLFEGTIEVGAKSWQKPSLDRREVPFNRRALGV